MDMSLEDKVAVVTGASKGIGLAIVTALVGEGARLVAGSRTTPAEIAAIRNTGDVTFVTVDLGTAAGPDSLVKATIGRHGRLDVLVNNLGATAPRTSFLDIKDAGWQHRFERADKVSARAREHGTPIDSAQRPD